MSSAFSEGIKKPQFKTMHGNIKADVLIVGGGISGILCAHMLKMRGVDAVVVEADTVCGGVTHNTTAKITCQHGAIFDKMIKRFGTDISRLYLQAQFDALSKYKSLAKQIDCDFEMRDSYVYSVNDRHKIENEAKALRALGCDAEFVYDTELPFSVAGAVCMKNQAQFNPLKFLYAISKDLNIYEKVKVTEIMRGGVFTNQGEIKADKIIVATHFPFVNKYGFYFAKMYQHRSYVIALENAQDVKGMYVDEAESGLSLRNYKNLLLLGGGGHRTGKKGGSFAQLRWVKERYYPQAKEVFCWATQDCKTLDDIPYIGRYSKSTPDLYVATGFNKWGMTSSMAAAQLLSDLVTDKENEYAKVFSPCRSMLRPQLAVNMFETTKSLLTPTAPRCSHMGCALKYNRAEHSWDCSCHGSRFTQSGKLINNPATDDLKQ